MSREKYFHRKRYLYALMFDHKRVYIGQSIDIRRRSREHARDWSWPFKMVMLGSMVGTRADAEEYEYAWRYKAGRSGFRVLCKSPSSNDVFEIDPRQRMTPERHQLASSLRWPADHGSAWPWWPWIVLAILLALMLAVFPPIGKLLALDSSSSHETVPVPSGAES